MIKKIIKKHFVFNSFTSYLSCRYLKKYRYDRNDTYRLVVDEDFKTIHKLTHYLFPSLNRSQAIAKTQNFKIFPK